MQKTTLFRGQIGLPQTLAAEPGADFRNRTAVNWLGARRDLPDPLRLNNQEDDPDHCHDAQDGEEIAKYHDELLLELRDPARRGDLHNTNWNEWVCQSDW